MKRSYNWWWGWIHVVCLIVAAVPLVSAQGMQVEATAGYDGFYRPGKWVPVFTTIDNRPADNSGLDSIEDFEGHLLLVASPIDERGGPMRFMRRIDVPRASTKRYTLYAKLPESIQNNRTTLSVNLPNGRTVGSPIPLDVQSADADKLILLSLSEGDSITAPNLPRLGERLDYFLNTKVDVANMGDHWAAYDSADVIVIPSWPSISIRPEQVRALSDWVQMGGTLVFLTGSETQTYTDDIVDSLLPVRIERTARMWENAQGTDFNIQTEGEQEPEDGKKSYVIALANPRPGAEVVLYEDEWPLIVRRNHGNGQVVFFANDFKSNSLSMDRLIGPYWFSLMPAPNLGDAEYEFTDALGSLKTLTGRAARPPNQFIIIIICLIYTLVVGPVNFAFLGRKKKLEWAWITVPVIVLVFFFLVYGLGRLTKSGENILREISVQRFTSGSELGESTTVVGTFAAQPGRYFMRPEGEYRAFGDAYAWKIPDPIRYSDYMRLPMGGGISQKTLSGSSPILAFEDGASNIYVDSWQMGIYDAATYVGRGPEELNGTIEADFEWKSVAVTGTIRNNSDRDFKEAWLIVGDDMLRLNELAAGDSVTINEDRTLRFVPSGSTIVRSNVSPFRSAPETFDGLEVNRPDDDDEVSITNFAIVMRALWHPTVTGKFLPPEAGKVYFLGYSEKQEVEETYSNIDAEITSRSEATLVRLNPSPKADQQFVVATPYLDQKLIGYSDPRGRGFQVNGSNELEISRSAGFFAFELPFYNPGTRVDSIRFDPLYRDDKDQEEEFVFEFFRFPSPAGPGGWIPVTPGVVVPNQGFALPGSGRIFVRVESREKEDEGSGGPMAFNAINTIQDLGVSLIGHVGRGERQ